MKGGIADTASGSGTSGGFVPTSVHEIALLFPQLEIIALIGHGGMGAVYKARQPGLDRLVALKILPPRPAQDPGFADRFTREARALAKLSHPNIVAVYDFGQAGGLHYFIMEYVDGPNLRQLEHSAQLAPAEALKLVPQICEALQFAHDEGIVHRDIKPENVLLDKKGRVKIADFGLAKILGQEAPNFRLTGTRDVMGTPHYMAPEQIEHPQAVDHRADIYSLGVVFYEMLTGELPLGRFGPPSTRAHDVKIDVRLDEVVLRALEREPERRYQRASEVKTDVESIAQHGGPPPAVVPGPVPESARPRRASPALRFLAWSGVVVLVLAAIVAARQIWPRGKPVPGATSKLLFPLTASAASERPLAQELESLADGSWNVSCTGTQVFRLFEVPDPGVENCTILYKARLKTEALAGRAYLEMWCRLPGLGESFSRGLNNTVSGTTGWVSTETPFFLKRGEKPDLIRLNLVVEGPGQVFIKDVRLESAPNRP